MLVNGNEGPVAFDGSCQPIWRHSRLQSQGVPISSGTRVSPGTRTTWPSPYFSQTRWRGNNLGRPGAGHRPLYQACCPLCLSTKQTLPAPECPQPQRQQSVKGRDPHPPRSWGFRTSGSRLLPSGPLRTLSCAATCTGSKGRDTPQASGLSW